MIGVGPIPSRIFRLPGQLLPMLPLSGQSKWLPILEEPETAWLCIGLPDLMQKVKSVNNGIT